MIVVVRRPAFVGVLLGAIVGLAACGTGAHDPVAVRVGRAGISAGTVQHWMSVRFGGVAGSREQVLGFLISSQRTIGEAGELGVGASDTEAQKQLEVLRYDEQEGLGYLPSPTEAALQRAVGGGVTRADRVWLMRLSMLATRIEQKRLANAQQAVTHAQIARYYDGHREQFVVPERRDVVWIVTYSDATVRRAMREVHAGKNLLSLAERISLDPPTINGMELSTTLQPELAEHVFATRPHVLAGPFRQAENHYIFEVTGVTPARQQTLIEVEASIRNRLATQKQRQESATLAAASDRAWALRTSCAAGYVVPGCGQYTSATTTLIDDWPYAQAGIKPATAGVVISSKRVKIGTILAAGPRKLTVYLSEADNGSRSSCYGACARLWPPVRTRGAPSAKGLARTADLGTITRADGTRQVTYFSHPLYYYAKDQNSHDVLGHGRDSFGTAWYAITTGGGKVER
jgi:predicted lipoprotein with Yx(FWY)xxD motif